MDKNAVNDIREGIPPQYAPKEPMSLREKFAQYSYDEMEVDAGTRAILEAANAGKDIVFGESHSARAETTKQMAHVIENAPEGHIKAIALELSVDMQELFDPVALQDMSAEDFAFRATQIEFEEYLSLAEKMYDSGEITQEQAACIENYYSYRLMVLDSIADNPESLQKLADESIYMPYYDLAKTALDNGIPVYAADADGERIIAIMLSGGAPGYAFVPPENRMETDKVYEILNKEDDRSDVEFLSDMGVDLSGPGVLLVHRGYAHINGQGHGEAADTEQVNGFDDILERSGREVLTVYVGPDTPDANVAHTRLDVHDPADIALIVDDTGKLNIFASPEALNNDGGEEPAVVSPPLSEMKM